MGSPGISADLSPIKSDRFPGNKRYEGAGIPHAIRWPDIGRWKTQKIGCRLPRLWHGEKAGRLVDERAVISP